MKFTPIQNFSHVCKSWETHGAVNEDRTVVFTSSPIDRCNFLEASDPLDKLRELLTRFTLCPRFETCGAHFGRMRLSNWSKDHNIKLLTEPGQLFDVVMGGWEFSGNFHDLSCAFSVYVGDKEIARELFELVIANYASDKYKAAVNNNYRRTTCFNKYKDNEVSDVQSEYVVYFNSKRGGFYVARPNEEEHLPITEEHAKHLRTQQGNWLMHAFFGAERIGLRSEVDYSQLLTDKLEDILK
ncbi:hypothetical protein SIPHO049v1_p0027 [Vibrio phage PS14A.1]|nr:hypothetical protein SIPHO049v1_p0027 [Vibrio phage PS14A.1]